MSRDDWTPEEQAALDELSRRESSDRRLEDRIVRRLRDEGVLRPTDRWWMPSWTRGWALAAASACVLALVFTAGYQLGSRTPARGSAVTTEIERQVHAGRSEIQPATAKTSSSSRVVWF